MSVVWFLDYMNNNMDASRVASTPPVYRETPTPPTIGRILQMYTPGFEMTLLLSFLVDIYLHHVHLFVLIELALLLGSRVLVLLVLGHKAVQEHDI